ncbi:hypothetical protein [Pandoraea sp. SD6-2]|uniref:hypothetical protein n=1 Tax=Pandoraea sp. SD6-2 TaxID=1286093 RepID=UPI0003308F77|nr:hypothetical protein [Pandoraea sp. SD6-2]EON12807.1 hypothetical protein C266_15557 [Pandoraea sp. SD6-2]
MSRAGVALTLAAAALLAGCATPTDITSTRASDYKAHIDRMFVVYDGDMRFGDDFAAGFRDELRQRLASCNIKSDFGEIRALMLDTSPVERKLRAFQPDVTLRVDPNGGVVTGNLPLRVDFRVNMFDMDRDATVWRGIFRVHHVGTLYVSKTERGAVFAVDIVNQLIIDGLIQNCPITRLDAGNRLPKRPTVTVTPTESGTGKVPAAPAASGKPAPSPYVLPGVPSVETAGSDAPAPTAPVTPGIPATSAIPSQPTRAASTPAPARTAGEKPAPQPRETSVKPTLPALPPTSLGDLPPIDAPESSPPAATRNSAVAPTVTRVESPPAPSGSTTNFRTDTRVKLDDLDGLLPAN